MEQQILFLINRQWTSPALDLFMALLSSFALWKIPLLLTAVAVLVFGRFKGRAALVAIGLGVAISDGIVANSLKEIVGRPRPHQVVADVRCVGLAKTKPQILALFKPAKITVPRIQPGVKSGNSFPSAHTMNNFCAATILFAFYRKRGWLAFIPAGLVAYSRMYTGSHWPSDVAISILLSIGLTLIYLVVIEKLWHRFAPTLVPGLAKNHPTLFQNSTSL